ncbi:hypothetical protein [Sphingosinicella sp. BN140058]|uniref:hypothetical protein n=1 Tax=Sphingosinicella sp. BN140058 TaxID=1892855 RepID=UPI001012F392|nr:hypothetical protein [Sphingosinicella sp. BN140058]QAY80134.1 hypothetical protein ETR14_26185 [Sphingosinicella sp. BN140058]
MTDRVPYRHIPEAQPDFAATPQVLEGQDITPRTSGWRQQHPQVRNLGTYGQPLQTSETMRGLSAEDHGRYPIDPQMAPYLMPNTTVTVHNNAQNYRPWKQELGLSFAKTVGNFFAWPFRFAGRIIEGLVMAGVGLLQKVLLILVAPMLLFAGVNFYQANKDRPATEIAADLGKDGVHLVGAILGGVWDGIFGDDEPTEKPAPEKKKAAE